jgi:aconitase A
MKAEKLPNPLDRLLGELEVGGRSYRYYDLGKLADPRISRLPISIKVLLECAIRNCDGFAVTEKDVEQICNWEESSKHGVTLKALRPRFHSNRPGSYYRI